MHRPTSTNVNLLGNINSDTLDLGNYVTGDYLDTLNFPNYINIINIPT